MNVRKLSLPLCGAITALALAGGPSAGGATPPAQCSLSAGAYNGSNGPRETGPVGRFSVSPSNPTPNLAATFDASKSSDADGDTILLYAWNFGDGTATAFSATPTIQHAFAGAGFYHVTLGVLDCRDSRSLTKNDVQVGTVASSSVVHVAHACKSHQGTLGVSFSSIPGFVPSSARVVVNGRTRASIHAIHAGHVTTIGHLGRSREKVIVRTRSSSGGKVTFAHTYARCR